MYAIKSSWSDIGLASIQGAYSTAENFSPIPQAMWWSMVTLTTVGCGDILPLTVVGKLIATLTAIMGVCCRFIDRHFCH